MPIHDWSRAPAGYFHHFHQRWAAAICDSLNAGVLPEGFFALIEQSAGGVYPDVLTLQTAAVDEEAPEPRGGILVADAPPRTRFVSHVNETEAYAIKANRVAVREPGDRLIAAIEIVSPGNKSGERALRSFVEKSITFLTRGVNLLVIDLLPPGNRDPQGLHPLIWGDANDEPFALPVDKPLTLASYAAEPTLSAYIEPVAVGDCLPAMPLFLNADSYISVPLESPYQETWEKCPREFRERVAGSEKRF